MKDGWGTSVCGVKGCGYGHVPVPGYRHIPKVILRAYIEEVQLWVFVSSFFG